MPSTAASRAEESLNHMTRTTKKTVAKKTVAKKPAVDDTAQVDEFMKNLDHPHKAAIAEVRSIILKANKKMAERIKWNVPSFYYKVDMAAFHPRNLDCVHVVFVFPPGTMVKEGHGLLEGDYKDRRMVKFADLTDVRAKKKALTHIVNQWVELVDGAVTARP